MKMIEMALAKARGAGADAIEIRDIRVRGLHGDLPDERTLGQRFSVDLVIWLDLSAAGASDHLSDTVDYVEVCRLVADVSRSATCRLMECLAQQIADAILDACAVPAVTVAISKRPSGITGMPREVTIRMTRERKA